MDYTKTISIGDQAPEQVNAFIEISYGSSNKYEYDPELQVMKLDRVLHSPFFYPTDYGFIPQTAGQDGDALDIMVLTNSPVETGIVMQARVIGLLQMKDEEGIDHKVLAVPVNNPHYAEINELADVPKHVLDEIGHFFSEYKRLEKGKFAQVESWQPKSAALELIHKAHMDFKAKNP